MSSDTIKFRQESRRKKRWREITTHVVLLLLVFLYSLLGAKLFQSIEEKHEERATGNLIKSKHNLLERVQLGIGSPMVDRRNWTKMVDRLLNYYVEDLAEATSHGVDITDVTQHEYESNRKWDFWGSLFYAGTVYTTIGYGNFAPVTPEGKIATIIYGTIGIPLCLILLADLGVLITKVIKLSVKKMKKQLYASSKKNVRELWPPQDEIDTMSGRSSFIVLCVVSLLYFMLGAAMYRSWEHDWSYLDAVYFIFVSTSTIGFGDVLPNKPHMFIFTSLYVFFGLSLLSSGFTILQDLLEAKISDSKADLYSTLGIQKAELDKANVKETVNEVKEEATPKVTDEAANVNVQPAEKRETAKVEQSLQEAVADLLAAEESEIMPSATNVTSAAPPSPVQEVIQQPAVVEETMAKKSASSTFSSVRQRFQAPTEASRPSKPQVLRMHNNNESNTSNKMAASPSVTPKDSGNTRVSETRLVSLDDGILSVEATIILDQ